MQSTRIKKVPNQIKKYPNLLIVVAYAFTILLNLVFRNKIPAVAGIYSPHDDLLGIQLTNNILSGNWLGSWDTRTLGKPPGYPIYLAIAHSFPLQLVVFNQIIFILVAGFFVYIIGTSFLANNKFRKILIYFIFIFIIFNPYLFGIDFSRVYRTNAQAIFLLLFLALILSIFLLVDSIDFSKSQNKSLKLKLYGYVGLTSVIYFFLILLRTESYWVLLASLPYVLVLLGVKAIRLRKSQKNLKIFFQFIYPLPIIAILLFVLPSLMISQVNEHVYGSRMIESYYSGNVAKTIKLWSSIKEGYDPRPFIVVSNEQRRVVYEISETANLMKPALEIKPGEGWLSAPCATIHLCDNGGNWFTWQLRDAAVSTGLIHNEGEFQEFFGKVANDILKACNSGVIHCGTPGVSVGTKPLSGLPLKELFEFSKRNVYYAFQINYGLLGEIGTPDSYGAPLAVSQQYHDAIHYRVVPTLKNQTPNNISYSLSLLQRVYLPIQSLAYFLAFIGYMFAWRNPKKLLIYLSLGVGATGLALLSVGVALASISFGFFVQGVYLLAAKPTIQFLTCVGIAAFFTNFSFKIKGQVTIIKFINFLKKKLLSAKYEPAIRNKNYTKNDNFDEETYLKLNPDVAEAVESGQFSSGFAHYTEYGALENRIYQRNNLFADFGSRGTMGRETFARRIIKSQDTILEIGPLNRPLVISPNVRYFDIYSRVELQKKAIESQLDPSTVPEIHFTDPIGDLSQIPTKFSAVVSAHCIEHQADMIHHLQQVSKILKNIGSKYYLIIPDRRYCFDYFLGESKISDIVQAHTEKARVPSKYKVIEHLALTTHNNPMLHWKGEHGSYISNLDSRWKEAEEKYLAAAGTYIDVHCWQFTPESFTQIITGLNELNLIDLKISEIYETNYGDLEFFAVLEKIDNQNLKSE